MRTRTVVAGLVLCWPPRVRHQPNRATKPPNTIAHGGTIHHDPNRRSALFPPTFSLDNCDVEAH
jgi:hypothetical protein